MKSHTSLLLGNGINHLKNPNVTWEAVLSELASFAGRKEIMDGARHIPLTLMYEQVIANLPGPDLEELEMKVKEKVAQSVQTLPRNSYREAFENPRFAHILTTSYDYNLGRGAKPDNLRPESKFSLFRRRRRRDQSFWMIHGEAQRPESIMLGHEQYAGALEKIRSYVTAKRKLPSGDSSLFQAGHYDFDKYEGVYSWIDVFLRDEIHILGYSLDYTEFELWWLLAYRARLKRKESSRLGDVHYYFFSETPKDPKTLAKAFLLESLGVKVHLRDVIKGQYQPHYDWALKHLAQLK